MDDRIVFENYTAARDKQIAALDARFGQGNWSWSLWMDQFPVWDCLTPAERIEIFGNPDAP